MTKSANYNAGHDGVMNLYKKCYFASANTGFGFKSYFNYIFNPELLKKIYIIKGGSGTGKSYLIGEIAKKAVEKNFAVEYFLCSSDSNSLDGIIIHGLDIAVIDGTAPHMVDPKYPGAVENIINIGNFWDEDELIREKDKICELIDQKSLYFDNAYKHLKAANEIFESVLELSGKYIYQEKLDASVYRIINKYVKEKILFNSAGSMLSAQADNKNIEYRFINSISANGCEELDTFEQEAKKIFYISNENFLGYYYTESLVNKFSNCKQIIIPHALNPDKINGVYLKDKKILFIIKEKADGKIYDDKYTFINMERFTDVKLKKEHKQKLRFAKKCYNAVMNSAVDYLKEAKVLHLKLEDIYISAMNFAQKGGYSKELIEKIYS